MKDITKENLLEAVQKVEDQNRLVRASYLGSEGCRCVVGHLMSDEELDKLDSEHSLSTAVGGIIEILGINLEHNQISTLSRLQSLNDRSDNLKTFLEVSRNYVGSIYGLD